MPEGLLTLDKPEGNAPAFSDGENIPFHGEEIIGSGGTEGKAGIPAYVNEARDALHFFVSASVEGEKYPAELKDSHGCLPSRLDGLLHAPDQSGQKGGPHLGLFRAQGVRQFQGRASCLREEA